MKGEIVSFASRVVFVRCRATASWTDGIVMQERGSGLVRRSRKTVLAARGSFGTKIGKSLRAFSRPPFP